MPRNSLLYIPKLHCKAKIQLYESLIYMTHFSRLLLTSAAALGLALSGCKAKPEAQAEAKTTVPALVSDISKDELLTMMKGAMSDAKATTGNGSPAMWTFSDDDTTVYLFGTVHLLKPDLEWRSPALDAALNEADTLVLEADATSPESQANVQKLFLDFGMFPEGETLTATLDDDDEAILSATLEANGANLQAVDSMKPWMVGLQLSMMQIMQAGYNPQSGVESVLLADAGDKELAYLETAETSIKALGGAPMEEQVQGLMATISTMELGPEYLNTLVAEWADGDVKGLGALMSNPAMFGTQEGYDALLTTRNKNWIPGIKALLDEPGTKLVAVGAAHLAGPDSVVGMLEKEGIKIKAVK